MASKSRSSVVARPTLQADTRKPGAVWSGWTEALRTEAHELAVAVCTHKHSPEYASCMGCAIRAKAKVRFENGGPSSAEVRANKDAKAAAKAALVPAVAQTIVPAQAPVGAAAQVERPLGPGGIGFRPRGRKGGAVATPAPAQTIDLASLTDPNAIRQAIEGLVARYKEVGGTL